MSNEKGNSGEYERDERTIKLLRELREKLHNRDISKARLAAHQLSWKQEDGLMILKEALFGDYPRTTKKAAAYGMRSMKGRMLKLATEAIEQGLKHRDRTTKAACSTRRRRTSLEPISSATRSPMAWAVSKKPW